MQEMELVSMTPFESASELQGAHSSLLEALDSQIGPDARADNATAALRQLETQVRQFLERGAATGIYLQDISDRTSCQVLLDYWVSSLSHAGLKVSGMRLARFDELKLPDLKGKPCPYVGLDAFRNQDFFFGREADTQQLLSQVHEAPLVVVLGASGSGKSSLVMGGVLPALPGSEAGPGLIVVPPFVPGNAVLDSLAKAVLQGVPDGGNHVREAAELLLQNPRHLSLMVGGVEAPSTLITIDQFEEVFTLATPTDREALVSNLAQLLEAGRGHRVILTVREEFRSRIVELRALSPYLDKAWYSMRPMSYEELKAAVEQPAALVNLQFQPGIVDDLVKKVLGQPAALPLLQFTLRMLWEKRDRNRITREVYQKVGDPLNALTANADAFYDLQAPQTQHEIKRILLELVRIDELLEAYRQPVPQRQLMRAGKANTEAVLELLDENDYVRISRDTTGTDAVVEVKHESLIRNWPRFVAWIDEKRLQRRQRLTLTQAAERWAKNRTSREGLLTGWQLHEAKEESDLLEIEQEFIQASTNAADDLQRKKEEEQAYATRVKIIAQSFAVIALICVAFVFYLNIARDAAERAQQDAEKAQQLAETAKQGAKEAQKRAEDLLGFLLGEQFLGQVREVGRSSMLEQVRRKVRSYEKDPDPKMALMRGLALRNVGDLERMHGTTQESLKLFGQALEAIESSLETIDRYRETARTYDRLGEALTAQGHVTQALSRYEAAVQTWRRVAADAEVNVNDCIGFADSLVAVGELQHRMGKTVKATQSLAEALSRVTTIPFGRCGPIANKGAPYPTAEALVVLSRARMLRGAIYNLREDYEGAVRLAGEAKRLNPASISAKRQEATALANLTTSKSFEDTPNTLREYRPILAEFDLLLHHDPTNRLWKREQAAVQLLIAEALVACHQKKAKDCPTKSSIEEGEVTNWKAQVTLRNLAEADPQNMSLRRDLGWALQGRAKVLEERGEHQARLTTLRESEQFYGSAMPDRSDGDGALPLGRVSLDQSKALMDLFKMDRRAKWSEVEAMLKKAVTAYETYGRESGTQENNLSILAYLTEAKFEEGNILRKKPDNKGAQQADRELKQLQDRYDNLVRKLSETIEKKTAELDTSHTTNVNRGADLFNKEKSYAAALREFNTAESTLREYADLLPGDYRGYDKLRNLYDWVRLTQDKLGKAAEARAAGGLMVDMARIASLFTPDFASQRMNDNLRKAQQSQGIAFFYSPDFKEHVDETLALVQREIANAEETLRMNPHNATSLRNLGNAYYGQGLVSRDAKKSVWEEAIRIGIVYIQKAAAIDRKKPEYLKDLGGMQKYLAGELDADGFKDKAHAEYRLALEAYNKAAHLSPDDKETRDAIRELEGRRIR